MKLLRSGLLSGVFLFSGCAAAQTRAADAPPAEGYVLAKKDRNIVTSLPAGKWIFENSSIQKQIKITFDGPAGKKGMGEYTEENEFHVSFEKIADLKVRATILKKEFKTSGIADGKPVSKTDPPHPVTGVPYILERHKDGIFQAAPEAGTSSSQQDEVMKVVVKQFTSNDDLKAYGDKPRKVGEKWPVEPAWIQSFLVPMKNVSGTASAELVGVEELRGSRCAVIRIPFKISGIWALGKDAPPSDTTFEGEIVTYRSLAGLVDLESKLEAKFVAVSKKEGVGTMTMSGPVSATNRFVAEKR